MKLLIYITWGLINGGGATILDMSDVNPSKLAVQGMGALVYNLMELWTIDSIEFQSILSYLIEISSGRFNIRFLM